MHYFRATLVLFLGIYHVNSSASYDGYKVFEITPKTTNQLQLFNLLDHDDNYDFWVHPRGLNQSFRVMVAPEAQEEFEWSLLDNELDYVLLIGNVQNSIQDEDTQQKERRAATGLSQNIGDVTFTHYMQHHEINNYLRKLAEEYSDIVNLVDFGISYEGREMLLLQISTDNFTSNKPLIVLDAGIHAREWIAPAVALYLINQLVEHPEYRVLFENVDWAIIPVLNPDGYEYTQTDNRLWRKTRTPPRDTECWGVDGNRNFDYQWLVAGASDQECSQTYAGPEPFSEVECGHLRDYFALYQDNIKLYLTLHSYGPLLLYPFGHTTDPADNYEELDSLAKKVKERIEAVNGTEYVYGSSSTTLYAVSGSSRDYAKGVAGINLSYTIELPPGGDSGFNPPASRIIPIAEETMEGFKAYHEYIEEKYVEESTTSSDTDW